MGETVTNVMTEFLGTIGSFFTQSMTWVTDVIDIIIASPALTVLCFAMPIVGFAVGLLGRLIRVG